MPRIYGVAECPEKRVAVAQKSINKPLRRFLGVGERYENNSTVYGLNRGSGLHVLTPIA